MLGVRNYSITKKLIGMNMLVSGAALLIACAAFVAYDLITFREAMVHNLSIQAQMAGSNSVSPLMFNDPHAAENTLSALKAAPNVVLAGIYTLDGRPFATYWRGGNGQTVALLKCIQIKQRATGSRMASSCWCAQLCSRESRLAPCTFVLIYGK